MGDDLTGLGPIGFQDLVAALAVARFGAGVQVMGAGRDGGRDMYFRGPLIWKQEHGEAGEVWDGYTVFQAKHKAELAPKHDDNLSWLWGQVRKELDAWADPDSDRNPVPDYWVIITNVPLTAVPTVGGHDRLHSRILGYVEELQNDQRDVDDDAKGRRKARLSRILRIRKWRVWDGNQVQTLLKTHEGIRLSFPSFLTAADVFAHLSDFTGNLPIEDLEPGLKSHARTTLISEGFIYFDEAGSADSSGIPVHRLAIDLPITREAGSARDTMLNYALNRAEHVLKPQATIIKSPRHLIVAGAPGNGKTTISKFLVQIFRAALLDGATNLSADNREIIDGVRLAVQRFGRSLPRNRRWPMRIDLAEYAQEGGLNQDSTLVRWIAHKVSMRSNQGEVKPWALQIWMRRWPWILILDGLDEVTEPSVRKRLIQRVTEFVNDAEADNCDVFVILTTRPIGYTENIAPTQFERIDLDDLELAEAVRYGELATRVRLRNDLDRIDKVHKQLRRAARDEALHNLLRTPLQVLIVTIIVDNSGALAPDRFSLFWGYYETVFRRERDKPVGLHRMLQEYGQQIQQLHERVGFELQVRSEHGERSYATLTATELRNITWQVLSEAGFQPSGKDSDLLEKIFDTATKRLVLIAPRGNDDGYGFDVRSLQELMAAMHLTSGPLDMVVDRLRVAAASPFWRNTWLFAAGRLFSVPQSHQHEALASLVETIDRGAAGRLGSVVSVGPRIALDIIDDGMTRAIPRWRDRFAKHALRVLLEPVPVDLPIITKLLLRFASTGDDQRKTVAEGLRDALGGKPTARNTATTLQQLIPSISAEIHVSGYARGLKGVRKRPDTFLPPKPSDGWEMFYAEISTSPCDASSLKLLIDAAAALVNIRNSSWAADGDIAVIADALSDKSAAATLDQALEYVVDHEPTLLRVLRDYVLPTIYRKPIGERLQDMAP